VQSSRPASRAFRALLLALAPVLAPPLAARGEPVALLKDINPDALAGSDPQGLVALGDKLLFSADDGSGRELWTSDGSSLGTLLVRDINPGGSSNPQFLTVVGGLAFFAADDGASGVELWKSDGTPGGTVLVKDINGSGSSSPAGLLGVGGVLFFAATDASGDTELWRSDGSEAGTVRVKDINGSGSSFPSGLTAAGGTLFFAADDGARGVELWKSDGTAGGTVIVADINGAGDASPQGLTDVAGTLFFSADDGVAGRELWKSDGTGGGTVLVRDVFTGAGMSSNPEHLTDVSGTLFFVAESSADNRELWKSDGTSAGTVLVRNILVPGSSSPRNLKALGGTLFFAADGGTTGVELWKSDGTSSGTVMVKNLDNTPQGMIPGSSYPAKLTDVLGALFFVAYGDLQELPPPAIGRELWRSDGTDAGTLLVADIAPVPDPDPSQGGPSEPTSIGGALFFAADDGVHGRELWAIAGADLSVTLDAAAGPLSLGDSFTYTIEVANAGPPTAEDVVATLKLTGPAVVASTVPGPPDCAAAGASVSCSLGQLALGDLSSVSVLAQSTGAGSVTGQASVTSAMADLNAANDSDSAATSIFPLLQVSDVALAEGDAGTTDAAFVVTVFPGSSQTVTVDFATSTGSAAAGSDYVTASGTLTFAPGVASQTVEVQVVGDTVPEPDETFFLELSNPTNAFVGDGRGAATVLDDEDAFLSIADAPTATEGNAGLVPVTFTVTLDEPPALPVTVAWATADGAASAGSDYQAASGVLSFAATAETVCTPALCARTLTVNVVGDVSDEFDETFVVHLSGATNAVVADGSAVGVVADDDAEPTLSVSDVAVTEGDGGTTGAALSVALSTPSGKGVTVAWSTASGTAVAGQDYVSSSGVLVLQPGVSVQPLSVSVLGDTLDEPLESLLVKLASPLNATIADGEGVVTVADDDPAPGVSISNVTVVEGDDGPVAALFQIALAAPSGQQATVDFETADDTALGGSDYTTTTGTVTFSPGSVTRTVAVPVLGDEVDEPTESFSLLLTGAANATILDGTGTATVVDNDTAHVNVSDASVAEGDAGSALAVFTLTLSKQASQAVGVSYATVNGTAAAGSDYEAATGSLSFAPGATSATVGVAVFGDVAGESDETFSVVLGSPVNVLIGDGIGAGTILNDDTTAGVSVSDVTLVEGNLGTTAAAFEVRLAFPAAGPVAVGYATSDGSAKAGLDYVAAQGSLTIPAGNTSQALPVGVLGDLAAEPNETFLVTLTGASGAVLDDAVGQATVLDDDAAGAVQFASPGFFANERGLARVNVVRLGSTKGSVSVGCATVNGSAEAGVDYQAVSGTLSFRPGQRSLVIAVPIMDDSEREGDETLLLRLFDPTGGATLGPDDTARLVIRDNEQVGRLQLGASRYVASEGGTAAVTVKRIGGSAGAVSVAYLASDGTARQDDDFAPTSGVLSFAPGQLAASFGVAIFADAESEGGESFSVALSSPTGGARLGNPAAATVTVTDAQQSAAFATASASVSETAAQAVLTLKRLGGTAGTLSVQFATAPGTADPGDDYGPVATTVDFGPGVATRTIAVPIVNDTLDEPGETVALTLTPMPPASGPPVSALLTIVDDDSAGTLRFTAAAVKVAEDAGSLVLTVSRTGGGASGVSVDYLTQDGTAQAGADYEAASGTLSFGAGQASRTLAIALVDDAAPEGDESFGVVLQNPQGGASRGSPGAALVTLAEDESTLAFAAAEAAVGEAAKAVTLTVRRSGATSGTATVDYATSDGAATSAGDYAATSGSVSFGPGITSRTLKVAILDDAAVEGDESFGVVLSGPTGAQLGTLASASVRIVDDEGPGAFSLGASGYKVKEVGPSVVVTVQRVGGAGGTVAVEYATADGSAQNGLDYAAQSGTLEFAPGVTSRTLAVPVTSDTEDEADETFSLVLSNPTGGAALDLGRSSATVTIQDDDSGGSVAFAEVVFTAGEGSGRALVSVVRTGGSASGARVDFSASAGTAAAAADFEAVSGTLRFEAGVTELSFEVPLLDDDLVEGGETIELALSNAGGGAVLNGAATAQLWVVDDE
jgi:ELWxxDGT repeat protein